MRVAAARHSPILVDLGGADAVAGVEGVDELGVEAKLGRWEVRSCRRVRQPTDLPRVVLGEKVGIRRGPREEECPGAANPLLRRRFIRPPFGAIARLSKARGGAVLGASER